MSMKLKRIVGHTFSDGTQSVIKISHVEHAVAIDGSRHVLLLSDNAGSNISIHNRAQLERLIASLRSVADNDLDSIEEGWDKD